MSRHPIGYETRLEQLTGPDAYLLGATLWDSTDEGYYYNTLRIWPHPDVDGAWTLSQRFAYLTKGDGSDGWTEEGMNMRISGEPVAYLQALAEMFAAAIPRVQNRGRDASTHVVGEEGE